MAAKMTLLQLVQNIMNSLDSDAISSITDTEEAGQVADIVHDTYEQMRVNQIIPEFQELGQLVTPSLITYPGAINYLQIPTNVANIKYIMYDREKAGDDRIQYEFILPCSQKEFLELVSANDSSSTDCTQVTDPTNAAISYYVTNNVAPAYWTSFDENFIAFDQIDLGIDNTQLLGTKTICFYETIPAWTVADSFIPIMDDNLFPFLLAEAKSTAWFNLKQEPNNKINKQAIEQKYKLQSHKYRTESLQRRSTGLPGPNYGRRGANDTPYYTRPFKN